MRRVEVREQVGEVTSFLPEYKDTGLQAWHQAIHPLIVCFLKQGATLLNRQALNFCLTLPTSWH